jgi:RHS repeat-associated protein
MELSPEDTVNHYKFTGKERDSESGLDNFGARYNSSQYGRFMSPDSMPINKKLLLNPQDLNLYTYALNNPIHYNDPDGRDWRTAWNDLKAFGGSLWAQVHGGVALEIKVTSPNAEARFGASYKGSVELDLNKGTTIARIAEIGGDAGLKKGPRWGENVSINQTILTVPFTGPVTGSEEPTLERTDTLNIFGGNKDVESSGEKIGIGADVGEGLGYGMIFGTTKDGLHSFGDALKNVWDEFSPPKPPAPTPPPPPCFNNQDCKSPNAKSGTG